LDLELLGGLKENILGGTVRVLFSINGEFPTTFAFLLMLGRILGLDADMFSFGFVGGRDNSSLIMLHTTFIPFRK
jgi:hypothetical protein